MPVLVDTNVLLDIVKDDAQWGDWATESLAAAVRGAGAVINAIVYAEFCVALDRVETADDVVRKMSLRFEDVPRAALFLAGHAYLKYRRRGGTRTGVLPDFFIGAHAAVNGLPLLTRDEGRYRSYFPTVELILP